MSGVNASVEAAFRAAPSLVTALLVGGAWLATALRRDFWPFSCYPMFDGDLRPSHLRLFRVVFVGADGDLIWWRPRRSKLAMIIGAEFQRALSATNVEEKQRRIRTLTRKVERVMEVDGDVRPATAVPCIAVTRWRQCSGTNRLEHFHQIVWILDSDDRPD
jgi:hypothetical protein